MKNIEIFFQKTLNQINNAQNLQELNKIKIISLGKKGFLTKLLKNIKEKPFPERKNIGKIINNIKNELLTNIQKKQKILNINCIKEKLSTKHIDITLPGRGQKYGGLHPITNISTKIEDFFKNISFNILYGPEIEDEYHNFEALNISKYHPARDTHDTFYFENNMLLRTHTSPIQIRAMQNSSPPYNLISIGKVYRCDSDITHTPMFHQVEGLMIDKKITFANLKGILTKFLYFLFNRKLILRFRSSFFPFTEPSAEIDIQCTNCNGNGCNICNKTGWLEIIGCGMVHPNVLKNCNINSKIYSGFAFGAGIDRITMLIYGINDLRLNFENNLNFLRQF